MVGTFSEVVGIDGATLTLDVLSERLEPSPSDWVIIEGVNALNPQTGKDTGMPLIFQYTGYWLGLLRGRTTVPINPVPMVSGMYRNVTELPRPGARVWIGQQCEDYYRRKKLGEPCQ